MRTLSFRAIHFLRALLTALGVLVVFAAQAQVSAVSLPITAGSGVARLRKISYTNTSLSNGSTSSFSYTPGALCSTGAPLRARRVLLVARFSANSLVDPGAGQPSVELHNMGEATFNGTVSLQLGSDTGPVPYSSTIDLKISNKQPEHSFSLDLTDFFDKAMRPGLSTRLTTAIVAGSYGTPNPNFRLGITLEESYDFAAPDLTLPAPLTRTDGRLEQDLSWSSTGCLSDTYQLQMLKLTDVEAANSITADEPMWRQRAAQLEMQTTGTTWRTTLAEGYGTYYYRLRAVANAAGGAANPENWGNWSNVSKIVVSAGTGVPNLASLNWIYSRTFTEGGRVAEKITFANGLLQSRQTLTRLASSQQLIGMQTLQDFVGRDAVQSLPIPLPGDAYLNFKPNLLRPYTSTPPTTPVPYQAADFDIDALVNTPHPASEQDYYSSTPVYASTPPASGVPALNEGVADAGNYPFARTLFARDGTNRVREQGSAGPVLGLKSLSTPTHTVRTSYAGVAQEELTTLMGREAPLATSTYKVISTDPNNVSTVSYQTAEGKTIATALSGSTTGLSSLEALPSAPTPGSGTTINETLSDRTDYNGVGSVGRKVLVITAPTTVNVSYTLDPKAFADECQTRCNTCDYRVSIVGYNLDDPTHPVELITPIQIPMSSSAAVCSPLPTTAAVSGSYAITVPGTYVIEKKVLAYNVMPGGTATYLEEFTSGAAASSLQNTYAAYATTAPWLQLDAFLHPVQPAAPAAAVPVDIEKFYAFLDLPANQSAYGITYTKANLGTNPGDIPTQAYYSVPFGCAPDGLVRIPVLQSSCSTPCNVSAPGFEQQFTERWDGNNGPKHLLADALPAYPNPGDFDAMITAMLGDQTETGYATKCSDLRACWSAQVESYDALVEDDLKRGGTGKIDLGQAFLECAWSLLQPVRSQDPAAPLPNPLTKPYIAGVVRAPVPAADRYHLALYNHAVVWTPPVTAPPTPPPTGPPQPPLHLACLRRVVGQNLTDPQEVGLTAQQVTAAWAALDQALAGLSSRQATDFYDCTRANTPPPTGTPLPAVNGPGVAAALAAKLQAVCEDRRGEFRQSVLAYIADPANQLSPNGQSAVADCQVDLLADELVQQCQLDALLRPADYEPIDPNQPNGPTRLTLVASQRLARIMNGNATVALRALPNASCGPDFETCPLTPDGYVPGAQAGVTSSVRPTRAAFELIAYANELVQRVNAINNDPRTPLYQRSLNDILKCNGGADGIGESSVVHFSLVGGITAAGQQVNSLYSPNTSSIPSLLQADAAPGRLHYWVTVVDSRDQGLGQSVGGAFGAYFFALQSNDVPWNPSNVDVCTAVGEESPGISKLPHLRDGYGSSSPYAYFSLYNPLTSRPVNKYDIVRISAPYAKAELFNIVNAPLTSSQGIYVMVTTRDYHGVTAEVEAEIRPLNPSGGNYTMEKVVWREVYPCAQGRTHAACLKWSDLTPLVEVPPGAHAPYTIPSCQELVGRQVAAAIQSQQQGWIARQLAAYRARYAATCADPGALSDHLNLSYTLGYHHFTLYYYDRAGNLMKTVPPAGVRPLVLHPAPTTPPTPVADYPAHQQVTSYKYNSLQQLVEQTSPDGGTTTFFYNRKGQLRYSLNDKQRAANKYSYTAYDALGRVIEVGESTFNYSADLAGPLADIETLNVPPTGNSQVTSTAYSTPATQASGVLTYPACPTWPAGTPQRYLNNRVSYSTSGDGVRTAYSYDPHGNVEWLVHDIPGLGAKYVRYEYDLISNKVLRVAYQEGQAEQFFHRYAYDDDNRLLAVQTSADGVVWEQDATYSYYAHGPLKRAVLGDDQVQALDYAYTLQGWLKAVNNPTLSAVSAVSQAAGKDGQSNGVAADAFGMVLGYFRGDYAHTGNYLDTTPGASQANILREPTPTQPGQAGQELFNGNIATWTKGLAENTSAQPGQAPGINSETFRYDQLNRLKGSYRSTYYGSSWEADNPNSAYATTYGYDANGNLQNLTRNLSTAGQRMDQLTYHYKLNADGVTFGNQLTSVSDQMGASVSDEDVDDQAVKNYAYDAVGNLTKDTQAGVSNITWTPYGKIAQVTRTNGTLIRYGYDAQGNRVSKSIEPTALGAVARTTYYVRDASGNPMAIYEQARQVQSRAPTTLTLVEQPLYGSARLGERRPALDLTNNPPLPAATGYYARVLGQKLYELTDHLGNVRAVVTDQKTSALSASTGQPLLSSLKPVLSAYYNYYPFGQLQPYRYGPKDPTANGGGYRFGFNGKEKDNNGEQGSLTTYDYGFRIYNPGIGRFLSVDPLATKFPYYTPYQFAGNKPIVAIDMDGLEDVWVHVLRNNDGSTQERMQAAPTYIDMVQIQKAFGKLAQFEGGVAYTYSTVADPNALLPDHYEGTLSQRASSQLAEYKAILDSHTNGAGLSAKVGFSIGTLSLKTETYGTPSGREGVLFALDATLSPNVKQMLKWKGGDFKDNFSEPFGAEFSLYAYDKDGSEPKVGFTSNKFKVTLDGGYAIPLPFAGGKTAAKYDVSDDMGGGGTTRKVGISLGLMTNPKGKGLLDMTVKPPSGASAKIGLTGKYTMLQGAYDLNR